MVGQARSIPLLRRVTQLLACRVAVASVARVPRCRARALPPRIDLMQAPLPLPPTAQSPPQAALRAALETELATRRAIAQAVTRSMAVLQGARGMPSGLSEPHRQRADH